MRKERFGLKNKIISNDVRNIKNKVGATKNNLIHINESFDVLTNSIDRISHLKVN